MNPSVSRDLATEGFDAESIIPTATRDLYMIKARHPELKKVPNILSVLIKDRSANLPIFFGTDNYLERSDLFEEDARMTGWQMRDMLTDSENTLFQPRSEKEQAIQSQRTQKRGEVLTPLWVVNQMIDVLEEEWKELSLDQYLKTTVLEICCGEAPFLVQRYDPISGEYLPVEKRNGIIDRKLKRINQQIDNRKTWMKKVYAAYRSVYGYEYQGDSLFLGRENMLFNFIEYYQDRWQELPTLSEISNIASIISWNLFQMDGLKKETLRKLQKEPHQTDMFNSDYNPAPVVTLWEGKGSTPDDEYRKFYGDEKMKFDVVIGNPAYQQETQGAGRQAIPVYNTFFNEAKKVSDVICLITPSRWFTGGMGLDSFRKEMLNDKRLKRIVDFTNSKDCFPDISVSGGVNYFIWDRNYKGKCNFTNITNGLETTSERDLSEFPILVRYNQAVNIIHKIKNKTSKFLPEIASGLMPFGLSTSFRGRKEKTDEDYIKLHTSKNTSYISLNDIKKSPEYLDTYHVLVSKTAAEHAGEPSKDGKFKVIPNSMKVIGPNEAATHSYFLVGFFDKEEDAGRLHKYLRTKFSRFLALMAMSGYALNKQTLAFIPLQDFTGSSDIDWPKSVEDIDQQLYTKYELSNEEISFIERHIKEMS